jgi:two-component system, sensor histidine kinase and response regulator
MMPKMNGYQVLEIMKGDPKLRDIPVIVISAVSDLESVVKCVELGAEDYLFKPFNPVLLKARLNAAMEKQRLLKQDHDIKHTVNEGKFDYISTLASALRVLMSGIRADADSMQAKGDSAILDRIKDKAQRTTQLVDRLYEIAQIEAGHLELKLAPVSISQIIEEAVNNLRASFTEKAQQVNVKAADDLPPVQGDQARLLQVVTELLDNAIKYTPTNGTITISATLQSGVVQVVIEDNGVGVSKGELQSVFLPYFRSSDPRVSDIDGNGLGLTIAKGLLEAHGGQIRLESEAGTRVSFSLPI